MKRTYTLAVAASLVLGSTAFAGQHEPCPGGNCGKAVPQLGAAAQQFETTEMGEHEMSGTISQINHETGMVSLATSEGPLRLHFPPQAVSDLTTGDKITAVLAFSPTSETGGVRAGDVPAARRHSRPTKGKELGEHTMPGTITNIDHEKGMLSLNTDAGPLQLHFPAPSVSSLKEGDRITVSLAYYKGGMVEKNK